MLLQREYDCITQNHVERLEANLLTESLFFACFYVLSKGLSVEEQGQGRVKEAEKSLRAFIMQAYEEIYHVKLNEKCARRCEVTRRGVSLQQTRSTTFTTILDLILISLIDQYDAKKPLFLNCMDVILNHNPSLHYRSLPDSYFITLPMTRNDESYLHLFTMKKPNLFNKNDNASKDIVLLILSALSPLKPISSAVLTTPISIDYLA